VIEAGHYLMGHRIQSNGADGSSRCFPFFQAMFFRNRNYDGGSWCVVRRLATIAERRGILSLMIRSKASTAPAPTAIRWRKSRKREP